MAKMVKNPPFLGVILGGPKLSLKMTFRGVKWPKMPKKGLKMAIFVFLKKTPKNDLFLRNFSIFLRPFYPPNTPIWWGGGKNRHILNL